MAPVRSAVRAAADWVEAWAAMASGRSPTVFPTAYRAASPSRCRRARAARSTRAMDRPAATSVSPGRCRARPMRFRPPTRLARPRTLPARARAAPRRARMRTSERTHLARTSSVRSLARRAERRRARPRLRVSRRCRLARAAVARLRGRPRARSGQRTGSAMAARRVDRRAVVRTARATRTGQHASDSK